MKLRERLAIVCLNFVDLLGLLGFLAIVITTTLTGCGSSTASARIMNASPGETAITATIGGTSVASSLDYGTASGYTSVSSGSQTLDVEQSSNSDSVLDQSVDLTSKDTYTTPCPHAPVFGNVDEISQTDVSLPRPMKIAGVCKSMDPRFERIFGRFANCPEMILKEVPTSFSKLPVYAFA